MKTNKLKTVNLKDIKPFADNPRVHLPEQIEKIKKSILKNGITQPIVITKNNEIIIGHGRHEALKQIDENQSIEVIQLDNLTKKEIQALRIADNKIADESTWDDKKLDKILKELNDTWNIDKITDLTGFDNDFVNSIVNNKEDVEDDVPEIDESNVRIKTGDLIELGRHRLLCGDCTDEKNVNRLMNGLDRGCKKMVK